MAFKPVKEDVAKDGMINVEDATTHIKELVIKSLNAGETKEQILSDVKRIIAKCIKGIEAIHDKETVMKSLWSLANQVLYEYTRAVQVFTLNAYNKAVDLGFMNDTYSYSFGDSKKIVDNFRNMIDSEKKDMIFPIIEDYQKKLRDTIRVLSAESPIAVEKTPTGATRKLGLRARAELQIRYEANMQELERYKTEGAKLVWITSHPNCSPRCAKYQGKLYSLDGTTGKIDGHSYEPIEVALAGPYGDGNGCISGYNCRHRLIEYKSGSKPPIEYTEAEIKRAYGIDREQRAYENEIRQMKVEERLLRAHGDTEAAKILRKKWRILTKKYEIFCLSNKRPMTTWRCVVSKEEMEDILKNNANVVDKPKNEVYNDVVFVASTKLMSRNDPLFDNAIKIKELDGFQDVVCHSDEIGFSYIDRYGNETNISPYTFAEDLVKTGKFINGKNIRLISCKAGKGLHPQVIANIFGVDVLAATEDVCVYKDGEVGVFSANKDGTKTEGEWKLFKPKK